MHIKSHANLTYPSGEIIISYKVVNFYFLDYLNGTDVLRE